MFSFIPIFLSTDFSLLHEFCCVPFHEIVSAMGFRYGYAEVGFHNRPTRGQWLGRYVNCSFENIYFHLVFLSILGFPSKLPYYYIHYIVYSDISIYMPRLCTVFWAFSWTFSVLFGQMTIYSEYGQDSYHLVRRETVSASDTLLLNNVRCNQLCYSLTGYWSLIHVLFFVVHPKWFPNISSNIAWRHPVSVMC
jgi:hypothetical protein